VTKSDDKKYLSEPDVPDDSEEEVVDERQFLNGGKPDDSSSVSFLAALSS
jgi:hypothetical protein